MLQRIEFILNNSEIKNVMVMGCKCSSNSKCSRMGVIVEIKKVLT